MVAFNTSSGIPTTFVTFKDAEGRKNAGNGDAQSNQAEAGTISMEFTTIGRLLGEEQQGWGWLGWQDSVSWAATSGHDNNGGPSPAADLAATLCAPGCLALMLAPPCRP